LDLECHARVCLPQFQFLQLEVGILILYIGNDAGYFNIETLNLLPLTLKLKILINHHTECRLRPRALANILTRLTQEIKISKEHVLNDIIP
jgi:hypothetical protein